MRAAHHHSSYRRGGVYIAVLGTSLLVALLGLTALIGQRIQTRMLVASADMRQAQLNALTATEFALLYVKQTANWRSAQNNGNWFTFNGAGSGTCSLTAIDPIDGMLTDDPDEAVTIQSIGRVNLADQRFEDTFDPIREPHDCLRNGSTAVPNWPTIVQHYQAVGTEIDVNALGPPQLARNGDLDSTTITPYWTGDITGITDDADVARADLLGQQYLRAYNREGTEAGPAQPLGNLIKPNKTYNVSIQVRSSALFQDRYRLSFYPDPQNIAATPQRGSFGPNQGLLDGWKTITLQFTTPNWTDSQLANAIIIVQSNSRTDEFQVDELSITEDTPEKYIYRQVLSASINPYGTPNPNGIYYIDCGGNKTVVIERSRIMGTLLILNPGANSRVGNGPIHWAPHQPGYPILLVNGAFSLRATGTPLDEAFSFVNFNPTGAPYYTGSPNTDNALDDSYPATEGMRGLIGVSGNMVYQNLPRITGRVFVGGTTSGSPTLTYRPDALLSPPPPLGGFYTYRYDRRPNSTRKVVQ